jgi:hypothetical protein
MKTLHPMKFVKSTHRDKGAPEEENDDIKDETAMITMHYEVLVLINS